MQRCSRCKQEGHNATSKRCAWFAGGQALQAQDHLAEDEVLGGDAVGVQVGRNDVSLNDSNLNDLLNSSEDDLY